MKFQKLDLQSMQNNDEDSLSNIEDLSPKDEIRQEESNLREEAISDLKFKLHDNFSHISLVYSRKKRSNQTGSLLIIVRIDNHRNN